MSERGDLSIKLFGRTIPLPYNEKVSAVAATTADGAAADDLDYDEEEEEEEKQNQRRSSSHHNLVSSTPSSPEDTNSDVAAEAPEDRKEPPKTELDETRQEDGTSYPSAKEMKGLGTSCENLKTTSSYEEPISLNISKNDEHRECVSREKTLKKPDKILPCPRCNSMDTKFCYYNNYNVNQPRHFCKNCQRYWTAGGTMRNVPVGSGRRKNKSSSASQFRHLMVSDAVLGSQSDNANEINNPAIRSNGTVLAFGPTAPFCESIVSALNLAEKPQNSVQNGFHRPELKIPLSCGGKENGDDHSSSSSITNSESADKGGNSVLRESDGRNFQALPPQVPLLPGPNWPCSWNSSQWRSELPPAPFGPSGFPVTFFPASPYMVCAIPGSWNMQWFSPPPSLNPSMCRSPHSVILGKHSRDGEKLEQSNLGREPRRENNSERCVWIPKTLRIDDPAEAAKSTIWSTLGIKNEKSESTNCAGLFKGYQSKGEEKRGIVKTSLVLQANPAALSRSLNFHESG